MPWASPLRRRRRVSTPTTVESDPRERDEARGGRGRRESSSSWAATYGREPALVVGRADALRVRTYTRAVCGRTARARWHTRSGGYRPGDAPSRPSPWDVRRSRAAAPSRSSSTPGRPACAAVVGLLAVATCSLWLVRNRAPIVVLAAPRCRPDRCLAVFSPPTPRSPSRWSPSTPSASSATGGARWSSAPAPRWSLVAGDRAGSDDVRGADQRPRSGSLLVAECARGRRHRALAPGAASRREQQTARRTGTREETAADDDERLRIARELHDTVAHALVAINVRAGVAAHLRAGEDPSRGACGHQGRVGRGSARPAIDARPAARSRTSARPDAPRPGPRDLAGADRPRAAQAD